MHARTPCRYQLNEHESWSAAAGSPEITVRSWPTPLPASTKSLLKAHPAASKSVAAAMANFNSGRSGIRG